MNSGTHPAINQSKITAVLLAAIITCSCHEKVPHHAVDLQKGSKSNRTEKSAPPEVKKVASTSPAVAPTMPTLGAAKIRAEEKIGAAAAKIAEELAAHCPISDASDQKAFERCRVMMSGKSELRKVLSAVTLWGRQNKDASKTIGETNLTQFAPDVLTGLYLPLFMYDGSYKVEFSEREKRYRVEFGALFRNRLQPGQFPYPFWHDDEKWLTYERANAVLLWFDPSRPQAQVAQFSVRGSLRERSAAQHVEHAFDGKWMWTDSKGELQPKVTLFDGLYRADNPFLGALDTSYKGLAIALREGQCMGCHVPNNPIKMKRLVLLQTPAHAAGEIRRIMDAVRKDRMPLDEATGIEEPLSKEKKALLLDRAASFESVVNAAKAWEATRGRGPESSNRLSSAGNASGVPRDPTSLPFEELR